MPDTVTPNYGLVKPEVTGSPDTWGGKLNGNFDALDAALKPVSDKAGTALLKSGLLADRTTDDYIFLKAGLDPSGQSGDAVMNNSAVRALLNLLLPIGTIIMWGGTVAAIPTGWALCDGSTVGGNTTPDLRNKFILQAGANAPGFVGGNATLSYSGNVGGHVLTVSEIPAHNHSISDPGHVHGLSDPGHTHSVPSGGGATTAGPGTTNPAASAAGQTTGYGYTGIGIATGYTNIGIFNTGGSQAHVHPVAFAIAGPTWYPPFYTLCYIMRVAAF